MANKDPAVTETLKEVLALLEKPPVEEKSSEGVDAEKAIQQAQQAMDSLNTQMDAYCKQTGRSREELNAFASDPKNFSKEDWALLQEIQSKLAEAGVPQLDETSRKGKEVGEKKKKKGKKKKDWIQG